MAETQVVTPPPIEVKLYSCERIPSGSTLLDLALGGGWAIGRIFNIVGDRSSGKTLVAIEAFANFKRKFPTGLMRYAEAEAAFDEAFAEQLGFPSDVSRPEALIDTVSDFEKDLFKFIEECKAKKVKGLYILDSLDAISSDEAIENFKLRMDDKKEKGSYGAEKAKALSALFNLLVSKVEEADCALGIISQIRENIGVTFGETKSRSGGKALDFYASQ